MAARKNFKEYHFEDGFVVIVKKLSAYELKTETAQHGKLLRIVETRFY